MEFLKLMVFPNFLTFITERSTTGTRRRVGAMREKIKRRRTLARGDLESARNASEHKETAQGSFSAEREINQRYFHSKDEDLLRGRET